MIIGKNGMVKMDDAEELGLPVFTWDNKHASGRTFDHCTKGDLELLGIRLTIEEQVAFIVGFENAKNYRGVKPLYSLQQVMRSRGI